MREKLVLNPPLAYYVKVRSPKDYFPYRFSVKEMAESEYVAELMKMYQKIMDKDCCVRTENMP